MMYHSPLDRTVSRLFSATTVASASLTRFGDQIQSMHFLYPSCWHFVERLFTDLFSPLLDRYLGGGDVHDNDYNHLVKTSSFSDLGGNRKYSGAGVNKDFCPYWVKVYPSDVMKDIFTSSDPIIFTVVAVAIFLFTSIVFLCYDFLVQTRQKRIMASAIQTNALVSNLFPGMVRDRVLKPSATASSPGETPKLRLKSYLREDVNQPNEGPGSSPIAEFFSETTVLFAGKFYILFHTDNYRLTSDAHSLCLIIKIPYFTRYRGFHSVEFCP